MYTMAPACWVTALLNDAIGSLHEEGLYVAFLPPGREDRASVVTQRTITEQGLSVPSPRPRAEQAQQLMSRGGHTCWKPGAGDPRHLLCAAVPWDGSLPGVSPGGPAGRQACPFCTAGLAAGPQQTRLFCFWLKSLIGAL